MPGYEANSIKVWMEFTLIDEDVKGSIPQKVVLDVIRMQATFALNDRPRCALTIPMGRRMIDGKSSPIHHIFDRLRNRQRAKVYLQMNTISRVDGLRRLRFPKVPVVIFEGSLTGTGYKRTSNEVDYVVNLEHWLSDLAYAPAISAVSSPENPGSLVFSSLTIDPAETKAGQAKTGGFTGTDLASKYMTPERIIHDFWGSAILPWMLELASMETIVDTGVTEQLQISVGKDKDINPDLGNLPARAALARIEPLPFGYRCGIPLAFDLQILGKKKGADFMAEMATVAEQISQAMGLETLEAVSSHTLWDKLIEYSASYMFAISPGISHALVIPFVPGLREEWTTIYGDEFSAASFSGDSPRILRGVGIYGSTQFDTGGGLPGDTEADTSNVGIGGYYQGAPVGQIMFKQTPLWLSIYPMSDIVSRTAGVSEPKRNAIDPDAVTNDLEQRLIAEGEKLGLGPEELEKLVSLARGYVAGEELDFGELPKEVIDLFYQITTEMAKVQVKLPVQENIVRNVNIIDRYARALYAYEVLKFRQGDITGKLRFDIAPGSTVRIECPGEKFLGITDNFGQELWGEVMQVDIQIDAENSNASTSFHLAHLRTVFENGSDSYSLDAHPLWSGSWSGCSLIR